MREEHRGQIDSESTPSLLEREPDAGARPSWRWIILVALTAWVLLVQGYHPFAEDGGVYAAGIEKLLNPALFPAFTAFTTEHLRFSLFAPMIAALVRITHLSLPWVLLIVYCGSIFAALAAAWSLTARVTVKFSGRAGALLLLACAITVPVAGTSLMLTDPYLTARSLSTPLTLFALAFTLDFLAARTRSGRLHAMGWIAGCLLGAALMHPLMTSYGLAAVVVLICASLASVKQRYRVFAALTVAALLLAGVIQLRAAPDSPLQTWVAMTRYYWFPFRWQWFEQVGLVAPLVLLAWLGWRRGALAAAVARAGWMLGLIAGLVAVCFCRAHYAAHLVARLQPLRCFSTVYLLMLLLLGAWLGEHWLRAHAWRWVVLLLSLGGLMFYVERQTFPATAHLELPGVASRNAWVQAFVWIRDHTPVDAVFAMDAHYITASGEDAQCFRAIAQRSALPDYSKDGGEASITPELTPAWVAGQSAQTKFDSYTDVQRAASAGRLGADWIVLRASSSTGFACPYRNASVKVCRME